MRFDEEISSALTRHWRKTIWRLFMAAIKEYELVADGDRIAVCLSGGKDSMLLAKCMQELKRHSPLSLELCFLCMDPGYVPETRSQIAANARLFGIPLEFFEADVFAAVGAMNCNSCYMCAKMRRGYLYRRAAAMNCNKIALGHHFDDVIETLLMSMLYAGQLRSMRPKLESDNVPGMQLIRPLYKVRERDILAWQNEHALRFPACVCAEMRDAAPDAKRQEIKRLIQALNASNPSADKNIFRSAHNAMLDGLNGWKRKGEAHSFLEEFRD